MLVGHFSDFLCDTCGSIVEWFVTIYKSMSLNRNGVTNVFIIRFSYSSDPWCHSIRKFRMIVNSNVSISISANRRPMQVRGPYPNGILAKGCASLADGNSVLSRNHLSGIYSCVRENCLGSCAIREWQARTLNPAGILYPPIQTSVCIVLRTTRVMEKNRRDSLMQALAYLVWSRIFGVTRDVLSGNTDITSSRNFSCFSGLFAI